MLNEDALPDNGEIYFNDETDQIIVDLSDVGKRLDIFLSNENPDYSRSRIQSLIDSENIKVNGNAAKQSYKLRAGDEISFVMPETKALNIVPENIPLDVVYEDDDVILINKPQGMVVHPAPGNHSKTLVNALLYHCGGSLSGINGITRPGIVHRIDKDTSGIIIVAKNDLAHRCLAVQLAEHSMCRRYWGITVNVLKQDEYKIDKPIGRNLRDRKKMAVTNVHSKTAVTHIKVLKRFKRNTLFEASLETGRTHQIRVHMASMGYPLLGDAVYGTAFQGLSGQVLHAKSLGFIHPSTKQYMEFDSPLPEYFNRLLERLGE